MATAAPALTASFTDASATISNAIFTHVTSITDGQVWCLLVGLIVIVLLIGGYSTGRAPAALKDGDFLSSALEVRGSVNIGGFLPTRKTSKFGGLLSSIAVVAVCSLCADVLVQYVGDYGQEHSVTTPALDAAPRSAPNSATQISVIAQRVGSTTALCQLTGLDPSTTLAAVFLLTGRTITYASPSDTTSALTCAFTVSAPSVVAQLPVYPVTGAVANPATLTLGLGPFLQASGTPPPRELTMRLIVRLCGVELCCLTSSLLWARWLECGGSMTTAVAAS